jgi:replicative DNA helicase
MGRISNNWTPEYKLKLYKELESDILDDYKKKYQPDEAKINHISAFKEEALKIAQNPYEIRGIATGLKKLDSYICGLDRGDLIVLGADTSIGKSLFAANIARSQYTVEGQSKPTLIFTLEMSETRFYSRFFTMDRSADMLPLYTFDNTQGCSIEQVESGIKKMSESTEGLGLVIVDHLQYFPVSEENQHAEVGKIVRRLKELAIQYSVPIMLLSQVRRQPAGSSRKRPRTEDLLGSSRIGQDADTIIILDRNVEDEQGYNNLDVFIDKNRNKGRTGKVEMHIDWKTLRIYEPN